MALGPAIALCAGIAMIYGGMLAAIFFGLLAAREEEHH